MLPTRVELRIHGDQVSSTIEMRSTSQKYIFGDLLGFYERYLKQLVEDLGQDLSIHG